MRTARDTEIRLGIKKKKRGAGVKVVWQLAGEAGRVGRSVEPSSDAGCFEIS